MLGLPNNGMQQTARRAVADAERHPAGGLTESRLVIIM
jgi:hypothetical protein